MPVRSLAGPSPWWRLLWRRAAGGLARAVELRGTWPLLAALLVLRAG